MQMSSISTSSPTIQLPQLLLTSDPRSLPAPAACPRAMSPCLVPTPCPCAVSPRHVFLLHPLRTWPGWGAWSWGVGLPPGPCPMAELPPQ